MHITNPPLPRLGALIAAAAASLAMSAALAGPAAADGPGVGTPTLVTVGDSLAAGEGGRWAGNTKTLDAWRHDALSSNAYSDGANGETIAGCHRSRVARSDIATGVATLNLACSGAKTRTAGTNPWEKFKPGLDFYSDWLGRSGQARALESLARGRNVKAVVVTIGANDYGFEEIVARCVWNFYWSSPSAKNLCSDDEDMYSRFSVARREAEANNVAEALANVAKAMSQAGYTNSQYAIILRTYWSPIPRGGQFRYPETGRMDAGGCGIYDIDANWANDVVIPALNSTLRSAAGKSGLANIKIVDHERMLEGRRLCESTVGLLEERGLDWWGRPSAVDNTEWVNRIRTDDSGPYQKQESAHASYWGQMAMRNCLRQAYNGGNIRGGECVRSANGLNESREPQMQLREPTTPQPTLPPLSVSVSCEPIGDYQIACDAQTTGGTDPYAIKWYVDGGYYGGLDNQQSVVTGCNSAKPTNSVKVVATDSKGATGERTISVACRRDAE